MILLYLGVKMNNDETFRWACLILSVVGFLMGVIGVWFSLQIGIIGALLLIIGLKGLTPNL